MDPSFELENTTRDVLVFRLGTLQGKDKGAATFVPTKERFVLGDAADRIPYLPNQRDERYQPNPIRTIDQALVSKLSPNGRGALAQHIRKGRVRVTRGDQAALLKLLEN